MKIISNYKDYYDAAQAYGIQQDLIYKRFQEEVEISRNPKWMNISKNGYLIPVERILLDVNSYYDAHGYYGTHHNYIEVDYTILGFCGNIYEGITLQKYENNNLISQDTFYELEGIEKYILNIQKKHKKSLAFEGWSEQPSGNSINEINFQEFFKYNLCNQKNIDIFQEIQAPIFTAKYEENKVKIIKNPNLKNLGFYRVMDTYLCFQEISQFLGGVLVMQENIDSNLSDLDKVKQHGFDEKYGFRKRPKKKK